MAESIVSSAAQHIVSMISEEATALLDLEPALYDIQSEFTNIQDYLVKPKKNIELVGNDNDLVRSWLAEMGRIAYETEDVVDTFVLDSDSFFKLVSARRTSKQLRRLKVRMQEVKSKLERYGEDQFRTQEAKSKPNGEDSTDSKEQAGSLARSHKSSKSHLHAPDDYVVGIDRDVDRLVKQLVWNSEDDDQEPPYGVAIVGMGGSGKTTLARKIYNHQTVKSKIKGQAWIQLSRGWDASEVMRDILGQTGISNEDNKAIGSEVMQSWFQGRKMYLVILDDVWESELDSLRELLTMLKSIDLVKIVITSRNRVLPPADSSLRWYFHETQSLSKDDGWKLFSKVASKRGEEFNMDFKPLSMEMLRKCDGLPLAIVALGKLLKTKDTIQEWEKVFSQIESAEGTYLYRPVNDILALSYDELPYYLKPCFLYLGLFPESSSISAGKLTRMWIAEGLVRQRPNESLEEAARSRLQELIHHTMVQVVRTNYAGKVKTLRIHDIMRELCIMKAREVAFLTICSSDSEVDTIPSRRAAINVSLSPNLPIHNPHLRSLMLAGQSGTGSGIDGYASNGTKPTLNLASVCDYFKLLRVLELSGIKTSKGTLPKQIGNLIHLKYLGIRSTNIRALPNSIGKLRNLLTLDYWDVAAGNEIKVPNVLWKLKRLRHLYLPNEMKSTREDMKLHNLKDLQTLWGVGGGNWMMRGMKSLSPTLKKLGIQGISSSEQLNAVFSGPIVNSRDCLYALALNWYGFDLESLDALHENEGLQKLRLMGAIRTPDSVKPLRFPPNLQQLELSYTQLKGPETMAALGRLNSLKILRLSKDSFIGSEWTCSKDAFPNLEELKLFNLPKLFEWEIELGAMPSLQKLSIDSCLQLGRIPEGLKFIITLQKLEVKRMPQNFCSRIQQVKEQNTSNSGGEDYHIVEHISNIEIREPYSSLYQSTISNIYEVPSEILPPSRIFLYIEKLRAAQVWWKKRQMRNVLPLLLFVCFLSELSRWYSSIFDIITILFKET